MFKSRVDKDDMLSFERAKLRSEMTKERREHAEKLRRERMELKDKLDERKYSRKLAEEERKKKRKIKAKRAKFFGAIQPHLPKKKKQGSVITRKRRIGLF